MINEDILAARQNISHIPLISKVFSSNKTKCIKNNNGVLACVNSKCTKNNPFMCNNDECECI